MLMLLKIYWTLFPLISSFSNCDIVFYSIIRLPYLGICSALCFARINGLYYRCIDLAGTETARERLFVVHFGSLGAFGSLCTFWPSERADSVQTSLSDRLWSPSDNYGIRNIPRLYVGYGAFRWILRFVAARHSADYPDRLHRSGMMNLISVRAYDFGWSYRFL